MEEKLVTIVVLPYSKAHILKMRLEAMGIECNLEELNFVEGTVSYTVKVRILERDVSAAIPVLNGLLGRKTEPQDTEPVAVEKHILVPVDFSVSTEKACKMAFNIASQLSVKIVFLHCYINPLIHSVPFSDVYAYDPTLLIKMDYAEQNANENFKKFIEKISNEIGLKKLKEVASDFIIKSGYPDEDILAYAEKHNSMLIVMGRGGISDNDESLGSVAVDIIYNAKVPVLVVPEDSEVSDLTNLSKVLYATNFDEKDFAVIDKLMTILRPFDVKLVCAHVGQQPGSWDLARLEGMKTILYEKYTEKAFECRLLESDDILAALQKVINDEKIDILSLTTHKRNMISRLFNPSFARKMVFHTKTPLLVFHA